METNELGTISGHGKFRRVEVKRSLSAPIWKVWDAISNEEAVSQWWAKGAIDAREGGAVKLGADGENCDEGFPLEGTIKVFQAPHILEYTWNEGYEPAMGIVRFDLVELDENRTQLTLVQIVPSNDVIQAAAGWHQIVEHLGAFLGDPEKGEILEENDRYRELCSLYENASA